MDDCPISGDRVLGGIAHAHRASEAHLRFHVDTLQAGVRDLEGVTTAREGYIKEKIARLLAREKDLWQKGRPMLLPHTEREREREGQL